MPSAALVLGCFAALAWGAGATIAWLWMRAARRADARAFAAAYARARAELEVGRRLGAAARESVEDVRTAIVAGLGIVAPDVDAVAIFDEEDGNLRCVAANGLRFAYYVGTRLARTDLAALPARALACGHRVTLADAGVRPCHPADAFAVAVPLARERGGAAVLYASARRALEPAALEAIVAFAGGAGDAYALAQEREADRRRAEYDALTGLLSPRTFRERLAAMLERGRFDPLARAAVLFVDTDRFKEYNDARGHAAGDALLRAVAQTLRAALRSESDLAARNGGDEFCLVFADCEKSEGVRRAEALRAAVAALGPISASIGVAAFPSDARTPGELLQRADEAMYHGKRSGRDAVAYFNLGGAATRLSSASTPA